MNILVTGGSGFIGINYALHRLQRGDVVTILDDFSGQGSKERCLLLPSNAAARMGFPWRNALHDEGYLFPLQETQGWNDLFGVTLRPAETNCLSTSC